MASDENNTMVCPSEMEELAGKINSLIENIGLEAYPFKIGWYNDAVKKPFQLKYNMDTVAFTILSIPEMFERCFIPFIQQEKYDCLSSQDPLDQCMKETYQNIKNEFKQYKIIQIHDYDVHANRRPKMLVQTCGHVAGAAYYYQQHEVQHLIEGEKLYGVSIHPKYGGWFAFRGVLIFEDLICPSLTKKEPKDVIQTDELKLELLRKFNHNWKDWTYRDVVTPVSKYSEQQQLFFSTPPSERRALIKSSLLKK